jgi:serine/threonine protein kinase
MFFHYFSKVKVKSKNVQIFWIQKIHPFSDIFVMINCVLSDIFYPISTEFYKCQCDGGNLENFINTSNDKLNFKLVVRFIDSLIESICALHEKGIIHRDIKTKNIFLFDKFNNLKIGDFGFTKYIGENSTATFRGSPNYISPEITKRERYKLSSDICSLGVVFVQLVSAQVEKGIKISVRILERIQII